MAGRMAAAALMALLVSGCGDPPPRQRDARDDDEDWARAARDGSTGEGLNVRVDVECFEIDERDAEGWSFFWAASIPIGSARLSVNGLRSATGGPAFFARLDAWRRRSTVRRQTRPFVVTSDGHPGMIEILEFRAEPVTLIFLDGGQVVDTYRWTHAGATLEVTPQRLGDGAIRLALHPVVSHREGAGRTSFKQLETVVTVKEDEAVVIGGTSDREDTFGSTFFSRTEGHRRYRLVFIVKARSW